MGRQRLAVGDYGTIRSTQLGSGEWRARCYVRDPDGRRREIERVRPSRAHAERALRAAMKERDETAGDGPLAGDSPFSAALDLYLAQIDESTRSPGTKRLYRLHVERHARPALGELRLRELTVPRVDRALQAIKRGSGNGAAKTTRSVLMGACGLAVRLGAMPSNPVRDVSPISRETSKEILALTTEQTETISDTFRSDAAAGTFATALDLPDLVDWMLGTGMREGEALAIRDDVLDLDAGTVEINATVIRVMGDEAQRLGIDRGLYVQTRTKSDAGWRVLALPPDLVEMLRRRQATERVAAGLVRFYDPRRQRVTVRPAGMMFTSPLGQLRDPSNTLRDLRRALDLIERPDDEPHGPYRWVTSHVFRKTVATRLDEAGLSAREIADVLGHKRPSMTQDVYMGRNVVSAAAATILARPGRAA